MDIAGLTNSIPFYLPLCNTSLIMCHQQIPTVGVSDATHDFFPIIFHFFVLYSQVFKYTKVLCLLKSVYYHASSPRVLGFVCMVLILWSPFAVPLLPALVKSWVTHSSSKFAELVCIAGLYASITMLIAIWGRRIRGYDNPFEQYGLDFSSSSKVYISAFVHA